MKTPMQLYHGAIEQAEIYAHQQEHFDGAEDCICGSGRHTKVTCAYCHTHLCKECGVYDERWWEWICKPDGDDETSECQRLLDVRLSDDRAKYVKLGKVFKMLKENKNGSTLSGNALSLL